MKGVRLALAITIAGGLVFLSSLSAAWSIASLSLANAPLPSPLVHPVTEMRSIVASLQGSDGRIAAERKSRMFALVGSAPLAAEPFTLSAYDLALQGSSAEAEPIVAIALTRNPRSREALLLSVDAKLANGEIAAAVNDLETLMRLMSEQRPLFEEGLLALASLPETRQATLTAVRDETTKKMLLIGLARAGADPVTLVDALQSLRAQTMMANDVAAIRATTQPLIDAGNLSGGYRVWSALAGIERDGSELVRDGSFDQGLPPPFGWSLTSGRDGTIAAGEDGMAGEIYGRRSAMLAQQVLMLGEGPYRLMMDVGEPSDLVAISLQCLPNGELLSQRLERAGRLVRAFDVPADCTGQLLTVNARASDPPRRDSFGVRMIAIAKGGR